MEDILLATEKEKNKSIGHSFHNVTFYATLNELKKVLGQENVGESCDGKTKHEWLVRQRDKYYSIYDWKECRDYSDDEMIEWHVGSMVGSSAETKFANDLRTLLYELRAEEDIVS